MIEKQEVCKKKCTDPDMCPWKCPDDNFFNCNICTNRCPCCTGNCEECEEPECANREN